MYPYLTTKIFFYFCTMDEKDIIRIAAETGIDAEVLRKYVEKLIVEEGMGKGAV